MKDRDPIQGAVPGNVRLFNALAPHYDEMVRQDEWDKKLYGLVGQVLEYKPAESIGSLVDLGSGPGTSINAAWKNGARPSRIVAVDFSSRMLRGLCLKHPDPPIETVHRSIEEFTANSVEGFDFVMAMSSLEFVKDLPRVVENIARSAINSEGVGAFTFRQKEEGGKDYRVTPSNLTKGSGKEFFWPRAVIERGFTSQGLEIKESRVIEGYQGDTETVNYNFIIVTKP